MNESGAQPPLPGKPVERLFPFVLRSRNLIVGRDTLSRSKSRLHFVLVTEDLSEGSRSDILAEFAYYPVVQHFTSDDLERFFQLKGTKVVGFQKSGLAKSIYAELKEYRINQPMNPAKKDVKPKAEPELDQEPSDARPEQPQAEAARPSGCAASTEEKAPE
jgi:hypothetical protein